MSKDKPNPATDAAEALQKMQALGFKTMTQFGGPFGQDWLEQMSGYSTEVLTFMAERMKADLALQHDLLQCRDIGEFQKIQSEFLQTAIEQYTAETGKMVEFGTKLMTPPKS